MPVTAGSIPPPPPSYVMNIGKPCLCVLKFLPKSFPAELLKAKGDKGEDFMQGMVGGEAHSTTIR